MTLPRVLLPVRRLPARTETAVGGTRHTGIRVGEVDEAVEEAATTARDWTTGAAATAPAAAAAEAGGIAGEEEVEEGTTEGRRGAAEAEAETRGYRRRCWIVSAVLGTGVVVGVGEGGSRVLRTGEVTSSETKESGFLFSSFL